MAECLDIYLDILPHIYIYMYIYIYIYNVYIYSASIYFTFEDLQ